MLENRTSTDDVVTHALREISINSHDAITVHGEAMYALGYLKALLDSHEIENTAYESASAKILAASSKKR